MRRAAARKAYDEAMSAAWKAFDKATAEAALKVYAEAIAPAARKYSNPGLLGRILLGRIKGHFRKKKEVFRIMERERSTLSPEN